MSLPPVPRRRGDKRTSVALVLLCAAAPAAATLLIAPGARAADLPAGYSLIFEDNFDSPASFDPLFDPTSPSNPIDTTQNNDGGLDSAGRPSAGTASNDVKWANWQPGVLRRDAINDPNAASIADGKLTIKTWSEVDASGHLQHHSGMIATKGIFEHAFGHYEARIDFNDSPGQWSAFWIYQDAIANNPSPMGATGVELDIMEHRALDAGGNDISGQGSSNTHWNGYDSGHMGDYSQTGDLGLDQGFHIYALDWTPDGYSFSIDGNETWNAPHTPVSNSDEYILLSSEVQDNYWAGHIPTAGYGSYDDTQTSLVVDYVRVYGADTAVPEPAAAGLLGLAGLIGLARRRRG